jgi:hypothetical protein
VLVLPRAVILDSVDARFRPIVLGLAVPKKVHEFLIALLR